MKVLVSMLFGLAVVLVLTLTVTAEEKKEVTLKGTIGCPKCVFKVEGQTKCGTAIKVKDGDKEVIYMFDDAAHKKYHKEICTEGKKGTVKGTIAEKDGKKTITVTKLDWEEKK